MIEQSYNINDYDRPSVTVDLVIFTLIENSLKVLMIKRDEWPFKDKFALPGGFVQMKETLENAAKRVLKEETGVKNQYLEQLYTFGDVKRDPRTRVITITYLALINSDKVTLKAGSNTKEVKWIDLKEIPKLAFDHNMILDYAKNRLKSKLSYSNIVFGLLPELFTLSEAQKAYELILETKIDKRNFRKKLASLGIVEKTTHMRREGAHRPASLYKLSSKEFELKIFD